MLQLERQLVHFLSLSFRASVLILTAAAATPEHRRITQ